MPFYVRNKQTGVEDLVDDEYDVKSGENVALRELSKDETLEVGYYVVGNRKSAAPGERVWVPAPELGEALKSKQFDTEELASAKKSRRDLISKSTSFAKGVEQGVLFNAADEARGVAAGVKSLAKGKGFKEGFDRGTDEAREMYAEASDANPLAYGGGELAGGVAVPIPGAGLVKGASTAAKVGRAALGGAVGGALSSAGAAEGGLSERGSAALEGGLVGGAVGGAIPAVAAGARQAKRVLPGATNAVKGSNVAAQRSAEMLGLDRAHSETYRDMLENPELYEKARMGRDALRRNPGQYRDTAQRLIDSVQGANSDIQSQLRTRAADMNVADGNYAQALDDLRGLMRGEAVVATQARTSTTYRDGIADALGAIEGKDLDSVRAARMLGVEPGVAWRLSEGVKGSPNPAAQEALRAEGNRLGMARKLLDDKLSTLENKTGNKASKEYSELLKLRMKVDERLKNTLEASPLYREADATHAAVSGVSDELGSLFNAPSGEVKSSGAFRLFKNSAADETAVRLNEVTGRTRELVDQNLGGAPGVKSALEEFQKALEAPQAAGRLAQLSGATGLTTGKSLIPFAVGGAAAALGAPGISGALALPATNPAVYLALINAANRGEARAVAMAEKIAADPRLGPAFRNLRDSVSRMVASGQTGQDPK